MTYGTIKVDTVTFTNAGVDKSVTLSGLVQNPVFSGNVTVTGTLSGVTVTGTTANFTSGNFANISGGTHTITSGVFAAGSAASPSITFTGDLNTGIYSPGADQVAISTGGSGRLFVDASGNVGVGTGGTQGTKLHAVGGNIWSGNFYEVGRFQKSSGTAISLGYDNSDYVATVGAYSHDGTPSNLSFWTYPGSGAVQERLRITSAGLVGVGTSTPNANYRLDTAGAILSSGSSSEIAIANRTTNAAAWAFYSQSGEFNIYDWAAGQRRLVIDSSGRVGVGTTSPAGKCVVRVSNNTGAPTAWNSNFLVVSNGDSATSSGIGLSVDGSDSSASISALTPGTGWLRQHYRANSHVFWYGDAGVTQAAIIDSSGRVGIGTSSPAKKLEVVEGDIQVYNVNAVVNTLSNYGLTFRSINQFGQDRGTIAEIKTYLGGGSDNDFGLQFRTQATTAGGVTTKMTLTPGGSLGIGTTSPGQALHVIGNIQVGDSGNERGIYVGAAGFSGAFLYRPTGDVQLSPRSGYGITFAPAPGSATEWGRWDSSGRLLVGTSSARSNWNDVTIGTPVQIEGGNENASFGLSIVSNSGTASAGQRSGLLILGRTAGTAVGSNTAVGADYSIGQISFRGSDGTNLIPGAAIEAEVDGTPGANDMPGRLVFSTTADGASSPTERMRISQTGQVNISHGSVGSDVVVATHTSGSFTNAILSLATTRAAGTACLFIYAAANGANTFNVFNNGNVTNTNNSYAGISDIKLKENIVDASSQWDDIKALQVRKYNFKEETGQQTHTQIGLVAQEVELVSPGLVSESPDRDAEGNDLGTTTKSVNYSVLYMKAVKALQEAMERIETLEASNTDLLARVSALESA